MIVNQRFDSGYWPGGNDTFQGWFLYHLAKQQPQVMSLYFLYAGEASFVLAKELLQANGRFRRM